MDEHTFMLNRERAVDYLNMLDRLFVFDGLCRLGPSGAAPTTRSGPFRGCCRGSIPAETRSKASRQPCHDWAC